MPLQRLANWAPFQIDALGLVTLFGAEEVNRSVGNLVQSWIAEYLPTLGTHVIAGNYITHSLTGFVLYNITDGIVATDITTWFTRWLLSYPLTYTATTITLEMDGTHPQVIHRAISMAIGVFGFAPLVVITVMMRDGWGIANFIAIGLTIIVRRLMVYELRASIDKAIASLDGSCDEIVKVFLTLPDGRAVTVLGPRMVVVNVLLTDPRPPRPRLYFTMRIIMWLAFGAHAISLGMSTLFHQILAVITLLLGTLLTCGHIGDREAFIGQRLRLHVDQGDPSWTRAPAYARLNLSGVEEQRMVNWNLMPHRCNTRWWTNYRDRFPIKVEEFRDDSPGNS